MTALIVVSIVALWVLVVFQGLVLLEAVRQISQIRRELDFDDRPVPFSVGRLAGRPVPELARAVWSENGGTRDGVFVLLSTDCATCRLVASGLRDLVPRFEQLRIVVILQARNHDEVTQMLTEERLARDAVVVDLENEYGAAFEVAMRPAAVVVRDGIVSEGAVVRNPRQLHQLLATVTAPTGEEVPAESSAVATST
jgi:hypothetical protein